MSQFKQRIAVSSIGIVLLLTAIHFALTPFFKPIYTLFIAGIIGMAVWEYYQIAFSKGLLPLEHLGVGFSIAYICALSLTKQYPQFLGLPELILGIALLVGFLYYFAKGIDPFINLAVTFFAFAYLTVPLGLVISITYYFDLNGNQDGRLWVLYLICVTKMTDIGGYIVGKKFGQTKLAPYISPKKTWEGSYGGLFLGLGTSIAFYLIANQIFQTSAFKLTFFQSIWLGAVIAILAQLGDLAESLLKRSGGIKDSNQLPGLGGVLDIVDSLVFSAPVVYIFLKTQF